MKAPLHLWRRSSRRAKALTVGAMVLVLAGAGVAAYAALKRPADVVDPDAGFVAEEPEPVAEPRTVDWPTYGFDDARTRHLPGRGLDPPFQPSEWSFNAGSLLEFSPVVANGIVYVVDHDGMLRALDAEEGDQIWRRSTGNLTASSPTYDDGRVFSVALDPGQVTALRARDGRPLWQRSLPGRSESSPLALGNRVFFGTEGGNVFALDVRDGSTVWQTSVPGDVKGALAYHDGHLFVGDYASQVYSLRASDGQIRWSAGALGAGLGRGGNFYSTPAVAFGRVYIGSIDGRVYSFDAEDGSIAWTRSTGDWVYAAPAVASTRSSPPTVYVGSLDNVFYALDAETGEVRWSHDVGGPILGAASVVGETVYVAIREPGGGGTIGFDVRTGEVVWEHELGEYNPIVSDGERIYLTGSSVIRAFEPETEDQAAEREQREARDRELALREERQRRARDQELERRALEVDRERRARDSLLERRRTLEQRERRLRDRELEERRSAGPRR